MRNTYTLLLSLFLLFSINHKIFAGGPDVTGEIVVISNDGIHTTFNVKVELINAPDFRGLTNAEIWIRAGDDILEPFCGAWDFFLVCDCASRTFGPYTRPNSDIITGGFYAYSIGRDGGFATTGEISIGALPVELLSFEAFQSEEGVVIEWSTASEENSDFFELQHSTNGQDFHALARLDASGASNEFQPYEYIHEDFARGDNYYRLKQVDLDGSFTFFEVAVVHIKSFKRLILYPTQVNNTITIEVPEVLAEDAEIAIYNASGVLEQMVYLSAGNYKSVFQVNDLPAGVYFVRFVDEQLCFEPKQFFKVTN